MYGLGPVEKRGIERHAFIRNAVCASLLVGNRSIVARYAAAMIAALS
jgi:hypothetical protein